MNKNALTLAVLATLAGTTNAAAQGYVDDTQRVNYPLRHDVACESPKMERGRVVIADSRHGVRFAGCGNLPSVNNPSTDEELLPSPAVIVVDVPVIDTPIEEKVKHPNKGEGNGSEGADPGNHPELGNDDENATSPSEDHGNPNRP